MFVWGSLLVFLAIISPFSWEKAKISSPIFIFDLTTLPKNCSTQSVLAAFAEKNDLQVEDSGVSDSANLSQES